MWKVGDEVPVSGTKIAKTGNVRCYGAKITKTVNAGFYVAKIAKITEIAKSVKSVNFYGFHGPNCLLLLKGQNSVKSDNSESSENVILQPQEQSANILYVFLC